MLKAIIPALGLAVTVAAFAPAATAGDIQGDAYECNELWSMRNQVYKDGGYCFKTTKAISHFGNAGCQYNSLSEVPLSENQRIVLRDIKRSERRQHC